MKKKHLISWSIISSLVLSCTSLLTASKLIAANKQSNVSVAKMYNGEITANNLNYQPIYSSSTTYAVSNASGVFGTNNSSVVLTSYNNIKIWQYDLKNHPVLNAAMADSENNAFKQFNKENATITAIKKINITTPVTLEILMCSLTDTNSKITALLPINSLTSEPIITVRNNDGSINWQRSMYFASNNNNVVVNNNERFYIYRYENSMKKIKENFIEGFTYSLSNGFEKNNYTWNWDMLNVNNWKAKNNSQTFNNLADDFNDANNNYIHNFKLLALIPINDNVINVIVATPSNVTNYDRLFINRSNGNKVHPNQQNTGVYVNNFLVDSNLNLISTEIKSENNSKNFISWGDFSTYSFENNIHGLGSHLQLYGYKYTNEQYIYSIYLVGVEQNSILIHQFDKDGKLLKTLTDEFQKVGQNNNSVIVDIDIINSIFDEKTKRLYLSASYYRSKTNNDNDHGYALSYIDLAKVFESGEIIDKNNNSSNMSIHGIYKGPIQNTNYPTEFLNIAVNQNKQDELVYWKFATKTNNNNGVNNTQNDGEKLNVVTTNNTTTSSNNTKTANSRVDFSNFETVASTLGWKKFYPSQITDEKITNKTANLTILVANQQNLITIDEIKLQSNSKKFDDYQGTLSFTLDVKTSSSSTQWPNHNDVKGNFSIYVSLTGFEKTIKNDKNPSLIMSNLTNGHDTSANFTKQNKAKFPSNLNVEDFIPNTKKGTDNPYLYFEQDTNNNQSIYFSHDWDQSKSNFDFQLIDKNDTNGTVKAVYKFSIGNSEQDFFPSGYNLNEYHSQEINIVKDGNFVKIELQLNGFLSTNQTRLDVKQPNNITSYYNQKFPSEINIVNVINDFFDKGADIITSNLTEVVDSNDSNLTKLVNSNNETIWSFKNHAKVLLDQNDEAYGYQGDYKKDPNKILKPSFEITYHKLRNNQTSTFYFNVSNHNSNWQQSIIDQFNMKSIEDSFKQKNAAVLINNFSALDTANNLINYSPQQLWQDFKTNQKTSIIFKNINLLDYPINNLEPNELVEIRNENKLGGMDNDHLNLQYNRYEYIDNNKMLVTRDNFLDIIIKIPNGSETNINLPGSINKKLKLKHDQFSNYQNLYKWEIKLTKDNFPQRDSFFQWNFKNDEGNEIKLNNVELDASSKQIKDIYKTDFSNIKPDQFNKEMALELISYQKTLVIVDVIPNNYEGFVLINYYTVAEGVVYQDLENAEWQTNSPVNRKLKIVNMKTEPNYLLIAGVPAIVVSILIIIAIISYIFYVIHKKHIANFVKNKV